MLKTKACSFLKSAIWKVGGVGARSAIRIGGLAQSMAVDLDELDVEDLGSRFGTNLQLSDKENSQITIEQKAVEGVLLEFQYMVAEVLTTKDVHGELLLIVLRCFGGVESESSLEILEVGGS